MNNIKTLKSSYQKAFTAWIDAGCPHEGEEFDQAVNAFNTLYDALAETLGDIDKVNEECLETANIN